jgi:hypothetical protein
MNERRTDALEAAVRVVVDSTTYVAGYGDPGRIRDIGPAANAHECLIDVLPAHLAEYEDGAHLANGSSTTQVRS